MPSASANISAKFMAQIEMSSSWVPRYSDPAEAISPMIVSISGRPAATSEPKARTRMISVTGHEISSLFIIAVRLAVLKSDHMPLAPVRDTCTPSPWSLWSLVFRSSAARTIVFASDAAPAWMITVCPSREIVEPACGGTTTFTRASDFSVEDADAIVRWNAGSVAVAVSECTTTMSALDERPWKFRSTTLRAATDSDPLASQPAPESAFSTLGAKKPRTTATSAQAIATARKCVAV